MEQVDQAIYKAMRDDSEATVGLRALLGNTSSTPFNVYHAFLPQSIDFSKSDGSDSYITYQFISGVPQNASHSLADMVQEDVYNITVYSRSRPTLESIHRRIKTRLQNKRGVTNPTSEAELIELKLDSESSPQWDDDFKIWFQSKFYRAWVRDDNIN